MMDRLVGQINFNNYFQLLSKLSSEVLGLSVYNGQGELIWQDALAETDVSDRIWRYVREQRIQWCAFTQGIDQHRMETGETIHLCCIQDELEEYVLNLAILTHAADAQANHLSADLSAALYNLCNGLQNEFRLRLALAASEDELSAMADEPMPSTGQKFMTSPGCMTTTSAL